MTPELIATVLHERRSGAGATLAGWFGTAITIWAAYFSATFHDALGLKSAVVESAFLFAGTAAGVATVVALIAYAARRRRSSVQGIVDEIVRRSASRTLP